MELWNLFGFISQLSLFLWFHNSTIKILTSVTITATVFFKDFIIFSVNLLSAHSIHLNMLKWKEMFLQLCKLIFWKVSGIEITRLLIIIIPITWTKDFCPGSFFIFRSKNVIKISKWRYKSGEFRIFDKKYDSIRFT